MAILSAGILMYRREDGELQVLLVHPGGPFWHRKDIGAWSIPKGELNPGEEPEAAARREFQEEIGVQAAGALRSLGRIRQRAGKHVEAFALAGDCDVAFVHSNMFEMIWPPGSGRLQSFPEVDRAGWFALPVAREKIVVGQRDFLDRLEAFDI